MIVFRRSISLRDETCIYIFPTTMEFCSTCDQESLAKKLKTELETILVYGRAESCWLRTNRVDPRCWVLRQRANHHATEEPSLEGAVEDLMDELRAPPSSTELELRKKEHISQLNCMSKSALANGWAQ